MAEKFYPRLSSIVKVDALPEQLGFIQTGLNSIFDKLYFKDLQVVKSEDGSTAFYSLTIISYKEIGFEIPGTGMELLLNHSHSTAGISEFPIQLGYEWKILKYINGFKSSTFPSDAKSFFNILSKNVLQISGHELVLRAISSFIAVGDPLLAVQQFVSDANIRYSSSIPAPVSTTPELALAEAIAGLYLHTQKDPFTAVYEIYIENIDLDIALSKIDDLFISIFGEPPLEFLKNTLIPKVNAALGIKAGLKFPREWLVPLDSNAGPNYGKPIAGNVILTVNAGSFYFSTEKGIGFNDNIVASLPFCQIGNTGLQLAVSGVKFDFSRTKNIPEATADGRPDDFVGVFMESALIGLPAFWIKDASSTAQIKGKNLLIGTGGLSGTIGLDTTSGSLLKTNLGSANGFEISLDSFDITFKQNAILGSNIRGKLKIPGFTAGGGLPAVINVLVHIGTGGDFDVTASVDQPLTALHIQGVLDVELKSVSIGRKDGRFYVAVSGAIDFADQSALGGTIGKFLPDKIDVQKMLIWEDGKFEFEGGKLTLPKAMSLKIGPVELSITAFGLGSHEQERNGVMRKYRYFTFDGGVNIKPGGVDASGNGIAFYFTVDGGPLHVFFRIQSIKIDIIIPGNATKETAALTLKGFLSMRDNPNPPGGTEYIGGVDFTLPKLKMGGSAAMRLNPRVPAFIVDIGLELSTPIVLGSTGLGIYGFRALLGQRYVASKAAAFVPDDGRWWQYYKAKIAPDYKEGIQISKFDQRDGFSLGAGVSLATAPDGGRTFSSKIFFLLSLPEVFLLQGQGQILKQRIGLDATQDPPFFALISITNTSVETAFGVNYQIPDEGDKPGSIATVNGVLEMGFFWGNSAAWYINIGRDLPENQRIQVRLLNLFNAYFYLMLSSSGIRAGAGASYKLDKKFGPLRAKLEAYLDVAGRISFRPKQIGGSIQIGGSVELSIFGFGFGISAAASLAAEAPKPFMISGSLKVCVRVLRKDRCAKFEFNWTFDNSLNQNEIRILKENLRDSLKALNMQTRETFELFTAETGTLPAANAVDNFMVPMDSYIDIEFAKSVKPSAAVMAKFGGNTQGSLFMEYFAPQRAKSDRVRHEYELIDVEIFFHNGSSWQLYDIYAAAVPPVLNPFVTPVPNPKYGFWQYQEPNRHNKLRIMAQSPISYVSQGSGDLVLEDSGITVETIFCDPTPRPKICIPFDRWRPNSPVPIELIQGRTYVHELFQFRITGGQGEVINAPIQGLSRAVHIQSGEAIELYFLEGYVCVTLHVRNCAPTAMVEYYRRVQVGGRDQPQFGYQLITTRTVQTGNQALTEIEYNDLLQPVDKVIIKTGDCRPKAELQCTFDREMIERLRVLLNQMAELQHLTAKLVELYAKFYREYNGVFFNTPLYPSNQEPSDVRYVTTSNTVDSLTGLFSDSFGYSCKLELFRLPNSERFDWSSIRQFISLRPDPDHQQAGNNTCFLADVLVVEGSVEFITTIRGCSCHVISVCKENALPGADPLPAAAPVESLLSTLAIGNRLVNPYTVLNADEAAQFYALAGVIPPVEGKPPVLRMTSAPSDTAYTAELVDDTDKLVLPFTLKAQLPFDGFRMDAVRGFRNLRPDPTTAKPGETTSFIIDAIVPSGSAERIVSIQGIAPVPVITYNPEFIKLAEESVSADLFRVPIAAEPPKSDCIAICTSELSQEALALEAFYVKLVELRLLFLPAGTTTVLFPQYAQQLFGIFAGTILYPNYNSTSEISLGVTAITPTKIEFVIFDKFGFRCPMTLEFVIDRPAQGLDIKNIIRLYNLQVDPQQDTSAPVYNFTIDADLVIGTAIMTIGLNGTSCYQINRCETGCDLYLYKVCVQGYEDAAFNASFPPVNTVQLETQTIINSFSGSIQPLWRPNTRYAIRMTTIDKLFRENGQSQVRAPYQNSFIVGFRTTGPIGHFHLYKNGAALTERTDYAALKQKNREDEFKLTGLMHYMDFDKSYPNADGQLINSKPLFFINPKLLLFYTKTYVYEMLRGWGAYNGLAATDATFEVQIIDPAANPALAPNSPVVATWQLSPVPVVSYEVTILNNMITQGTPCVQTTTIDPLMLNSVFPLAQLQPLKLYTAVFVLKYRGIGTGSSVWDIKDQREVLRYGFQTSRYGNFAQQINSYKLKVDSGGNVLKAAVFTIEEPFAGTEISVAQQVAGNTLPAINALHQTFGDRFNRLLEGALKLVAVDPPQTTEFNIVRQSGSNRILGILVKNPEPFNDPKMVSGKATPTAGAPLPTPDLNALTNTIELSVNGQPVSLCKAIFSKDASQAFVTNANNSMSLPAGTTYTFTFRSKSFDGAYYQVVATETVTLTIS